MIKRCLLGGSPCTFWSIAQSSGQRETEPNSGIGWELFHNYIVALEKYKPDYFLYENNASMSLAIRDEIDKAFAPFGGYRIKINSSTLSAQQRNRYYWTNIPNVKQPEQLGLTVADILDYTFDNPRTYKFIPKGYYNLKKGYQNDENICLGAQPEAIFNRKDRASNAPKARQWGLVQSELGKSVTLNTGNDSKYRVPLFTRRLGSIQFNDSQANRIYTIEDSSVTLNANAGGAGGKVGLYVVPIQEKSVCVGEIPNNRGKDGTRKSPSIEYSTYDVNSKGTAVTARDWKGGVKYCVPIIENKLFYVDPSYTITLKGEQIVHIVINGTLYTLQCSANEDGNTILTDETEIIAKFENVNMQDGFFIVRALNTKECARLQTVPEWYNLSILSKTQQYKVLGNGWTIEVIKHILSNVIQKHDKIEILSLYDGMSCGNIALKELEAEVVRYVSYEIDKYAIQITQNNFSFVEQRGDAFQIKEENWKY